MGHPRWVRKVFSERDLDDIAAAVRGVEETAAAEVRVHLERRVPRARGAPAPNARARATDVFHHLDMHKSQHRNHVLVYLALEDRKLAIVGDEAIHARVGDAYWEHVRDLMIGHLKAEAPRDAVVHAVEDLGRVLREHFPRRPDDGAGERGHEVRVE